MNSPSSDRPIAPIRWWPAAVILGVATGAAIWIQYFKDVIHQQQRNIETAQVAVVAAVLLIGWMLMLSRLRWRTRGLAIGTLAVLIGVTAAAVRVRGVTGDLIPVLEFRWATQELAAVPTGIRPAPGRASPPANASANASAGFGQLYGPDRNGKLSGPVLARDWSGEPPTQLWRQPVGAAWSGFAIEGIHAVTMEQRGDQEFVTCYHLATGELLWAHADDARYHTTIAGEGPRSVPTLAGGRVYTVGATGILNCLELESGAVVWSRNFIAENGGSVPEWGVSGSPLVDGERVIVSAGGKQGRSLVAYHFESGAPLWSGGESTAHYSSPVVARLNGVRQVLIFNKQVTAHDMETGTVLWSHAWRTGHPHICPPVILDENRIVVSSGYGTGSQLLQTEVSEEGDWSVTSLWTTTRLKSKFANIVEHDGCIYGLDDGIMVCLDLATGERRWKRGRYGHGQLLLVGDVILVMSERGDVVLVEPDRGEHRELTRFTALDGKTWNPPAMAGDVLVVRNDKEAACYRLPCRAMPPRGS